MVDLICMVVMRAFFAASAVGGLLAAGLLLYLVVALLELEIFA